MHCYHIVILIVCCLCIAWNGKIYLSLNQNRCNVMRGRSWFIISLWQLVMWLQFMHLDVICNQKTTIIKRWICLYFCSFTKWNNWYLFYVGVWYTTINDNLFIHFTPIMYIYGRNLLCYSIMTLLLMFVISIRLIIKLLLLFTIIICRNVCFLIIPINLCFNFTRAVWFMIYKNLQ